MKDEGNQEGQVPAMADIEKWPLVLQNYGVL